MIISVPCATVFRYPDAHSEHTDDAVYGTECEILDSLAGFCRVRTSYGYEGYVRESELTEKLAEPNRVVTAMWADLVREPVNCYAPELTLPFGSLVDAGYPREYPRYAMIVLPDKRMFWVRAEQLGEIPAQKDEQTARKIICETAKSFLGVQYRWGGRTHAGIDCSGLAFTSYRAAGITIWRDADPGMFADKRTVSKEELKPGDLIFFPGHVAVHIENGRFIHATSSGARVCYGSLSKEDGDYSEWCANNIVCCKTVF